MTNKGFTLVELLITIAIMSISLSLVSGLVASQSGKYNRYEEQKRLDSLLKVYQARAFATERIYEVVGSGNTLKFVTISPKETVEVQFEHLTFKDIQFSINKFGYPSATEIHYLTNHNGAQMSSRVGY